MGQCSYHFTHVARADTEEPPYNMVDYITILRMVW